MAEADTVFINLRDEKLCQITKYVAVQILYSKF